MADGNIRYELFDAIAARMVEQPPAGIAPSRVRRHFERHRREYIRELDPLVPYYTIPWPAEPTTPAARTAANLEALDLLAALDRGEKIGARRIHRILGRFSGWGGLSLEKARPKFPSNYEQDSLALAHEWYTPYAVGDAIAKALAPLLPGIAGHDGRLKALEPSAGVGRLIAAFNTRCVDVSIHWWAVELNPLAAKMAGYLVPKTTVFTGPFERFNASAEDHAGTWNLLVANPPFGSAGNIRVFALEDPAVDYRESADYAYFMRRGLDALTHDGIGVFIVPNRWMTGASERELRAKILRRHHLMAAFRLPSHDESRKSLFSNQGVVTDVIFFRSRGGELIEPAEEDEYIIDGNYFREHPEHLLGREELREDGAYRYTVIGEFTGFPKFTERAQCRCDVQPYAPTRRATSRLVRQLGPLADDPALSRAQSLGLRVDAFLARLGRDELESAAAEWAELHDALRDLLREHGNPWMWHDLLQLAQTDPSAQALLRGITHDGKLLPELARRPDPRFTTTVAADDLEGLATALYRQRRRLAINDLLEAHRAAGGTLGIDEVLERILGSRRWMRGLDWDTLEPAEVYLTGWLWPKYDAVTERRDDPQAQIQADRLITAIAPRPYEELQDLSPQLGWMPVQVIGAWLKTLNLGVDPELRRVDGLVSVGPGIALQSEALWCLGWINHHLRIFAPEIEPDTEGLTIPEAVQRQIKKAEESGDSVSRDILRLLYRLKWLSDFRKWLDQEQSFQEQVVTAYNRTYRGFVTPSYDSTPIEIVRWTRDPQLQLKPHQIRALKARAATRGGILGFDVGVGKTFTCLAIIALGRQEGWIRRPVIVVPAGIIWQWAAEVEKVLPDYRVCVIGSAQRIATRGENRGKLLAGPDSADDRAAKWTGFQLGHYDLVLLTDTALGLTQVSIDDLVSYAEQRTAILYSLRLRQQALKARKKLSERDRALLNAGVVTWVQETLAQERGYDPGPTWSDLGIDFLAYDEVGNIRRTWGPQPREFGIPKYMGATGSSWRAWQADFRAALVRKNTKGSGILALTGTLGENSPLEIFNIFQFVDPTIFEKLGVLDPEQFVDRYLDIEVVSHIRITGEITVGQAVTGFTNLRELRDVLFRWGSFISAREAGLRLPKSRECLARVDLSPEQEAIYSHLREEARTALRRRQRGRALAAIGRMRTAAIHEAIAEGYSWKTAAGGLARKKVADLAVPVWLSRGWSLTVDVLAADLKSASPEDRPRIAKKLAKITKREMEKPEDGITIERLLPRPADMSNPRFEACAERVLRNRNCGHIIFSQFTATHYWIRETLVKRGIPRHRIGVINGETGDMQAIAAAFNGNETTEPTLDVVIANSKAYRGANLQRRTCAIHHIDLTWTPADLEQRRGRGDRQGNILPAIQIWFYLAENSFDGYMFGLVAGKARWQDELYRGEGDRSTNPAAQLELSDNQLLRLTAGSEEEAAQLEEEIAREQAERERKDAEQNALRLFRQAAGRFRESRRATSARVARHHRDEGEKRLQALAAMSDTIWPWKNLQSRLHHVDALVPLTTAHIPLFEDLRIVSEGGERWHFGKIVEGKIGQRAFGSPVWMPAQSGYIGQPAELAVWRGDEDDERTAQDLARRLSLGPFRWEELGWRWAPASWVERIWGEFGSRLVRALANRPLPIVEGTGSLRLVEGEALQELAEHVLPPTPKGYAVFVGLAERSELPGAELREVARFWWSTTYSPRKRPEIADGEGGRRPVVCPQDVLGLRPPLLLERLSPLWEALGDQKTWPTEVTLEIPCDGAADGLYTVQVRLAAAPTLGELSERAIDAMYRRHRELSAGFLQRQRDLAKGGSKRWLAVGDALAALQQHARELTELLDEDAAQILEFCAHCDADTPIQPVQAAAKPRGEADEPAIQVVESGSRTTVEVTALPTAARDALYKLGYRKSTVDLEARTVDDLRTAGGDGRQGRTAIVNLRTGTIKSFQGNWGGSNPFSREENVVDGGRRFELDPGLAVVHVVAGGRSALGYITLHPTDFAGYARVSAPTLATGEALALAIVAGIRSGYRDREFRENGLGAYGPDNPWIQALVRAGLIALQGPRRSIRITSAGLAMRHQLRRYELAAAFREERAKQRREKRAPETTTENGAEDAIA